MYHILILLQHAHTHISFIILLVYVYIDDDDVPYRRDEEDIERNNVVIFFTLCPKKTPLNVKS